MNETKKVSINDSKYNIYEYLGKDNIEELCKKENIVFFEDQKSKSSNDEQEQNKTLIQFYLKELDIPNINTITILKCLVHSLSAEEEEKELSSLWTNQKNLEHYFMDMLTIF